MNHLYDLAEKYGTDKNLSGYINTTYFELFKDIKNDVKNVLEIGLGTLDPSIPSSFVGIKSIHPHYKPGGSLRVWRDFFTNANVYGVDIAKDCMFEEDRIKTFLFDSSEANYVDYYLKDLEFDIIIDDGNHDPKYQIKTLKNLLPKLKEGGIYIIEDVNGYGGEERLMVDYLDMFNSIIGDCYHTNKGNHIVIKKSKQQCTTDLISKVLHHIGKNNKNAQVIQIGAMDGINFDNTRGFLDLYGWPALLVEPIPFIYEELKNNFKDRLNYSFEQCAIANHNGFTKMLTIPPNVIENEGLHPGYKGMSAMYPLRNGFGSDYQRDIEVKNKFGIDIEVPTLTFESLLDKHNLNDFDILICDAEGYDWNIFKQIDLKKYRPKFIRLEYINLTDEEKKLTQQKLKDNGYVVNINQDIDAVPKELWDIIEPVNLNQKNQNNNKSKKNYTIVTGLWDIGRTGRNFEEHYLPNLENFLRIDCPMVIFVPSSLKQFVESRRSSINTRIEIRELEDVKKMYNPFWDKTQEIRNNPNWYNLTGENGWLKHSPQASLEWYNPIVQTKMFWLHDASIWNTFETDYFYWLDAGITNTVSTEHLIDKNVLDSIPSLTDPFLFLSYPYITNSEIHGFEYNGMNKFANTKVEYVCRGGLFGGQKHFLSEANATYYSLLHKTLNEGYMGTEESIFTIMSYLEPEKYRRYSLDGNGLIGKFTDALINHNASLESIPEGKKYLKPKNLNTSQLKTSLYMLTFNFPQQVRYTLEKYKNHPDFLNKTRKILIDNSNKPEAIEGNKQICLEYGFEHIITGENLGINRGRFKAAEHFDQSDSDFYIFLEDDMGIYSPQDTGYCRNGFRKFVPDLYEKIHKIMLKEEFDFLKLTFTEVFMDNHLQVSWYNVPQSIRTEIWPHYDKLPVQGLDPNCPRTKFDKIDVVDELAYISGEIYYANWPMIVGKEGNRRMFLNTTWGSPYEQTWMSHMFQETRKGNLNPAVLLASPIEHNRIVYYKPEERREN